MYNIMNILYYALTILPCRVHTAYVAMPERLPIGLAVGRKASNLRRIMNAVGCLLTRSERSEREVCDPVRESYSYV